MQAAAVVTAGFYIGVSPVSYFNSSSGPTLEVATISLVYGFISSLMVAVHAVLVKSAHGYVDGSVVKLTYWTNFISAFALVSASSPARVNFFLYIYGAPDTIHIFEWRVGTALREKSTGRRGLAYVRFG